MTKKIVILIALVHYLLFIQAQTKVIDMHAHSYTESDFGQREPASDYYGNKGSVNAESHRKATFAAFKKANVIKAMVSGNPESVENWASKDSNHIMIKGILMYSPNDYGIDTVKFEQMIKEKKVEVFGELAPYYDGATLSDSIWQPYLRICEK